MAKESPGKMAKTEISTFVRKKILGPNFKTILGHLCHASVTADVRLCHGGSTESILMECSAIK
jgi:hypothetical protein